MDTETTDDLKLTPASPAEWFQTLESPLLAFALRISPSREDAEDAVQEAFFRLGKHWAEVQSPRAWLYRTVRNIACSQIRSSRRHAEPTDPGEIDASSSDDLPELPDAAIERLERHGLIRLGLSRLPARSQEVIRLKYVSDLSYREIAERTGISATNVGFILSTSLRRLAQELDNICFES